MKKRRRKNGAGNVRNYAVPFVETEWIAFLDDDDTIADDYVTCLQKQIEETPDLDVLIFRMKHQKFGILPPLSQTKIKAGKVGISFSLKTKIMKENNHIFVPGEFEDYKLLNKLLQNKYKIMFYPFVKYFVRSFPKNIMKKGTSTKFNFDV